MQKGTFILALLIYGFSLPAQQTRPFSDPDALYEEAQTYFQQELYSLAYPLLKELELQLRESDRSSRATLYQQIKYYTLVCGLKQNEPGAALQAEDFINIEDHAARVEQMSFHLGEYYFRRGDYTLALEHYGQTSVQHLSNREVADYKFHQGYAYFSQQKYDLAKPLFNVIRQVKSDPNYAAANYYFGFISFYDKEYASALKALEVVENHPEFGKAAPYFISVIRFMQGQKQEAFDYAEKRLSKSGQLYEREMQQLVGHGYYLQQQFEKALPFLEQFAAKTARRSRADIFELAYCQYKTGRVNPAIEGFRQLSGKEDSLAQQAMYVLGDLYLKKGEKENARNAFLFCSSNSSNTVQREISMLNYAKLSFELGYQDIALREYQEFLETYPQSAYAQEAREGLVRVLANTNNYKEALTLLESIQSPSAEAMKSYPRVLYGRATEFINDGALPAAEALLTKAETFSGNAEQLPFIYYWKGELAYRRGQVDEAIRYFQNYLKSPQAQAEVNPLQAKYNLAYCYLKKENYSKAKPLFDEVGGSARTETQAWQRDAFLRSADCSFMTRDYAQARIQYTRILDGGWSSGDYATFQLGLISGINNSRQKIEWLTNLVRNYPNSDLIPDAYLEIAGTHLADERYEEAIPFLKQVTTSASSTLVPKAYLQLGIAYFNLNKNDEALQQYTTLLQRFPNSTEAEEALENARAVFVEEGRSAEYVEFARKMGKEVSVSQEDQLAYQEAEVQFNNGNFLQAVAKFEQYLSRFPNGKYALEANFYKSEIYFDQKEWAKAAAGYATLADRVPHKFGERSVLQSARLNFFDLKDFAKAKRYYEQLKQMAGSREIRLEAMRGLLRSEFQLNQWAEAAQNARDLLDEKGIGTDDQVLANLALARSLHDAKQYAEAITYYRNVAQLSKAAYGAEARYQIAACYFEQRKLEEAEKASFQVINGAGSYEEWVTKAYLLLGDIYFAQKDYFNAKATFQSVIDHSTLETYRVTAEEKLKQVVEEEKLKVPGL